MVFQGRVYTPLEDQSFNLNGCKITPFKINGLENQKEHPSVQYMEMLSIEESNEIEPLVSEGRMYSALEDQSFNLNNCKITSFKINGEENQMDGTSFDQEMDESSIAGPSVEMIEPLVFKDRVLTPLEDQSFILGDFKITPCK